MTGDELAYLGREPALMPAYTRLLQRVLELYPKSEIRVQKTMFSFRYPKPFCYVSLPLKPLVKGGGTGTWP